MFLREVPPSDDRTLRSRARGNQELRYLPPLESERNPMLAGPVRRKNTFTRLGRKAPYRNPSRCAD